MVSDHGSRKGPNHGVGVDPETVNIVTSVCEQCQSDDVYQPRKKVKIADIQKLLNLSRGRVN